MNNWRLTAVAAVLLATSAAQAQRYEGRYYVGEGDTEYLQLLDASYRLFSPDVEWPSMAMLYMPAWNGLVEGPTWDAWWIQNSYGTTFCALPFYVEPYATWLQNSQDLWFRQMGDGKRRVPDEFVKVAGEAAAVPPDGNLCDAARPGWIYPKQGDGNVKIHDWPLGFDCAGLLMQAELLLISRDIDAIVHYLPMLERVANFVDSRRDPNNNLFLAGPAANLLAPSYAGYRKADGTYDKAYLAEVSVTYIAALDRLIELEKMAGDEARVQRYTERRDLAHRGLRTLTTPEGYLVRSIDPDGTKHGVYGAAKHGYFEASPNHDAIALRVVDDTQANQIYDKIASIPQLRPYDFIIPNYPGYDDMYVDPPTSIWVFGHWVNGGHWSTCEARIIMGYYRLGKYEDARRSMRQLLGFARRWRMDNPLVKFGSDVYQPNQPVNITYDAFGPPAAMIRGLFEYLYGAEGLTLVPHIPPGITAIDQRFPIRLGESLIFLRVRGVGDITRVDLNGNEYTQFDKSRVLLDESIPEVSTVTLYRGNASATAPAADDTTPPAPDPSPTRVVPELKTKRETLERFARALRNMGGASGYEVSHADLAMRYIDLVQERRDAVAGGKAPRLPEASQAAADKCYLDTANKLYDGLDAAMRGYENGESGRTRAIHALWMKAQQP